MIILWLISPLSGWMALLDAHPFIILGVIILEALSYPLFIELVEVLALGHKNRHLTWPYK